MKKKKMEKIFTEAYIPLEIFPVDVFFTTSKEKFIAMCEWINVEPITDVGGRCMLNTKDDGKMMLYIGVFEDSLSTLAHECVHAGMFIAEAINHNVIPTDEIVPYITGYLFGKCQEKMAE